MTNIADVIGAVVKEKVLIEQPPIKKKITTSDLIDEYFDEKRMLITDKIGDAISEYIGEDEGDAARMYLLSGEMLRSVLALMCYEVSGGDTDEADDVAAIIEMAMNSDVAGTDIFSHNYAEDIECGVQSAMRTPGAILRGDFGFVGGLFDALRDGPRIVSDSMNAAKVAVGSTIAEVSRGDFTSDAPYVTHIKAKTALSMAIACKLGSEKAGAEECVDLCSMYGRNLGVVYAVTRDLNMLNTCIEDHKPSQMMLDGKLDLCMMYALDRCGTNAIVNTDDSKWLFKEFSKEDAYDDGVLRLQMLAKKYTRAALKAAKRLPDNTYKDMLLEMPKYIQSTFLEE